MNKKKLYIFFITILVLSSCSRIDEIDSGCSIRVSNKVYEGEFNISDINYIKIINGVSQTGLYPLPNWETKKNMTIIKDISFFKKFKRALIAAGWKKEPPTTINIVENVQIFVSFKKGPGAYLFCRNFEKSLGVTPMFEHDSYGNNNEPLFHLINNTIKPFKK